MAKLPSSLALEQLWTNPNNHEKSQDWNVEKKIHLGPEVEFRVVYGPDIEPEVQ